MKYHVINESLQNKSTWSGGTTTEIFIYPEHSNYKAHNFSWRISSATVDQEECDFTSLYGVKRWIMPFEAPLLLKHKADEKPLYDILVKPYEPYCFKGDWETKSIGKTRDFNLMLKEGSYGMLKHFKLSSKSAMSILDIFPEIFDSRLALRDKRLALGVYNIETSFNTQYKDETIAIDKNELFLATCDPEQVIEFNQLSVLQHSERGINLVVFFVAYD